MSKTGTDDDSARWFVVRYGAARPIIEAAIRGALIAQRVRLTTVQVDVLSDGPWPAAVRAEAREAERRLAANRRRHISLTLDPSVDEDFAIALALAPFSIGATGISTSGRMVWDANDTGNSAAFELTRAEEDDVRCAIINAGGEASDLITLSEHHLSRRKLNYGVVGGTASDEATWQPPVGWRAYERTVRLGVGTELWEEASAAVLSWGVKTRSGFTAEPHLDAGRAARRGERYWLVAHIGPLRFREPVEIIDTVATEHRAALAYGTLNGHPVAGEEAFIVHRDETGNVALTLRSLTHAGRGGWRALFPLVLIAQRRYRRRYLRALRSG